MTSHCLSSSILATFVSVGTGTVKDNVCYKLKHIEWLIPTHSCPSSFLQDSPVTVTEMGLTTAFLFASCIIVSAVSAKQRRDIWLCDGLASCMTAYNRYGDPTAVTALDQLKTSSVLDSYCSSVSGLGSCVKSEAYMCWFEDEVTEAETAVAMTEYICANKAEFLNIANMPNSCLRTLANPMEAETDYCIAEFQSSAMILIMMGVSDTSEICPLVHEMGSCIIRKMKDVCESEVVAFLDGIMTSFINPLGEKEFGCSPSSTFMRRLVRDAMEKLKMKRSNLIENTFFRR